MPASTPSMRRQVVRHLISNAHPPDERTHARVFPRLKLLQPNQAGSLPKLKRGKPLGQTLWLWRDSLPRHDNVPQTKSAANAESSPVERPESKDDDRVESGKWYPVHQFFHRLHGEKIHQVDQ